MPTLKFTPLPILTGIDAELRQPTVFAAVARSASNEASECGIDHVARAASRVRAFDLSSPIKSRASTNSW